MRLLHWSYFLALEEDLLQLARYVEFSNANFKAYSIEMAHLLLASSSESDVLLKMICNVYDPKKSMGSIPYFYIFLRGFSS